MTLNDYHSLCHATSNENGREQIILEFERTLWQKLTNKPATILEFEKFCNVWFNKKTGTEVNPIIDCWLERVKRRMKYLNQIDHCA